MYKIFIIEDDQTIAKTMKKFLESWGYQVSIIKDFYHVMKEYEEHNPDIVLMDISLPYLNGFHWCEQIRKVSQKPIIFISSANDNMNVVMAISKGADDFVTKPFDLNVLLAKIQAVLRRCYEFNLNQNMNLEYKDVIIDAAKSQVVYEGDSIELTKNEFKILKLLFEHKEQIVSRDYLMEYLWDTDEFIDDNTLTVNINRLRKKLGQMGLDELIKNQKGSRLYALEGRLAMKLLGNYLRDKKTIYLSCIGVFFIYYIIYRLYRVEREALLYAFIVSLILLLFIFVVDYKKYKRQVDQLDFILNNLQMGYINYLNDFDLKSEKYREIIVGFEEEYRSREGQLEDNLKAQGEFFMMWTHQVKLPISASKLILETEENINRRDLKLQLNRIDQYTDMVMAYIRLNSEDSDFVFEAVNIDKVIKACIKIFKIEFIHNNIKLKYSPLNKIVITDTKWFSFAVEQIVSNALKYTSEGEISIYIQGDKLIVQDTGMGISKGDLPRIFQKGYTGYNGRSTHKSSGLGLYLTKSVLDKLHHSIAIESEVNKGTKVSIGLERYEFKGE